MSKGFTRICGYLNDIRTPMLGKFINANEVLTFTRGGAEREKTPTAELPWGVAERGDLPWMSGFIVDCALDAVGLGRGAEARKRKQQEREQLMDPEDLERKRKMEAAIRSLRIRSVLTTVGGVAAFVGYCIWSGFLQIKLKEEEKEEEEEEEVVVKTEEAKNGDDTRMVLKGPTDYDFAGAILGLRRQPTNPDDPVEEEHNGNNGEHENEEHENEEHDNEEHDNEEHDGINEELSPEEEEDIANDIRAEEDEIDEAIAKDLEEEIDGKAE